MASMASPTTAFVFLRSLGQRLISRSGRAVGPSCNDLVTWPGHLTWSPDMAHNLIRAIPRSHEFSSPHRRHHFQASPKTSDRSALHLHLWRPSSLREGLRSNISTKTVALEGATSYYAEGVTSYYAEGVTSYYAEDGTSYYAEVGTL